MDLTARIKAGSQPLENQPSELEGRTDPLPGIEAVLFDVYGTLFMSGSGDIGVSSEEGRTEAVSEALVASGVPEESASRVTLTELHAMIQKHHARLRQDEVITYPEVRIEQVWEELVREKVTTPEADPEADSDEEPTAEDEEAPAPLPLPDWFEDIDWKQVAVEYELRANPVWPMPGAADILRTLRSGPRPIRLGIISNAQFFTKLLFPALLDTTIEEFGFEPGLCVWSYEHNQAKPGKFLYEVAKQALADTGVQASSALFIGNDMRNDVAPAIQAGFKTALFGGDERSLRLRTEQESMRTVFPDRTVTHLSQLERIVFGDA